MSFRCFWDVDKERANRRKHGLGFDTAQLVFDDPYGISEPDRVENGELRWQTIGMVEGVTVVLVAHADAPEGIDGDEIRIISARRATSHERKRYEQEKLRAFR